ncbi:Hypothetical predicted protein [Xyrichtys novacula]|uniref:Uncharacterized protein n=1 Tax=Xyrichtys novacula TaxID=13765 RepID=A0AAV1HIU4_XYRNO|nr:Hypothetical predicted protein [Xyrichtys novacula]
MTRAGKCVDSASCCVIRKPASPPGYALNEPTVSAAAICNKRGDTHTHVCCIETYISLGCFYEQQQQEEEEEEEVEVSEQQLAGWSLN